VYLMSLVSQNCSFLMALSIFSNVYFRFVFDLHTELDFYSACSRKQQSACRDVASFGHITLIPSPPDFALTL
jgi:hypothetical protein